MKFGKGFLITILILVLLANSYYLFQNSGLVLPQSLIYASLIVIGALLILEESSKKPHIKKNLIKTAMIFSLLLFLASFSARIFETSAIDTNYFLRWSQTVLYGILFIVILSMSENLYYKLLTKYNSKVKNKVEKNNAHHT